MLIHIENYEAALAELQAFLDAPNPPAVGSPEAERFADFLDAIELYESSLIEEPKTGLQVGD